MHSQGYRNQGVICPVNVYDKVGVHPLLIETVFFFQFNTMQSTADEQHRRSLILCNLFLMGWRQLSSELFYKCLKIRPWVEKLSRALELWISTHFDIYTEDNHIRGIQLLIKPLILQCVQIRCQEWGTFLASGPNRTLNFSLT